MVVNKILQCHHDDACVLCEVDLKITILKSSGYLKTLAVALKVE